MEIKYIKIYETADKYTEYNFASKFNLIYSKKNSQGKTTLLRFILFALGYNVPATEGIGNFDKYSFEMGITKNSKDLKLYRKAAKFIIEEGKNTTEFTLPEQQFDMQGILFDVEDFLILENLLAIFYIDQEKGWTMLNRGKIIGNNRFNIEDYISGLSGKDLSELHLKIEKVKEEIKKYNYLLKIVEFKDEITENPVNISTQEISKLIKEKNKLHFLLADKEKVLKSINATIKSNHTFLDYIEKMDLYLLVDGKSEKITKDRIENFSDNDNYLKCLKNQLNFEISNIKSKLKKIEEELQERNQLFDMNTILQDMEQSIKTINLDKNVVENTLNRLKNQRTKLNKQLKEYLANNNRYLSEFYDAIEKYSIELGIKQYIKNDGYNFVLTRKLKGFSGKVLAQLAFTFKLAYLKAFYKKYKISLPIIIDSPRTSEMTEEATIEMMNILKRDFKDYQIIIASVYDNLGDFMFNKIIIENGVLK